MVGKTLCINSMQGEHTDGSECHGVECMKGAKAFRRLKVRHRLLRGFTKNVQGLQNLGKGREDYYQESTITIL